MEKSDAFEQLRGYFSISYRILGDIGDAEDRCLVNRDKLRHLR